MATIIDGKATAKQIREEVAAGVTALKEKSGQVRSGQDSVLKICEMLSYP